MSSAEISVACCLRTSAIDLPPLGRRSTSTLISAMCEIGGNVGTRFGTVGDRTGIGINQCDVDLLSGSHDVERLPGSARAFHARVPRQKYPFGTQCRLMTGRDNEDRSTRFKQSPVNHGCFQQIIAEQACANDCCIRVSRMPADQVGDLRSFRVLVDYGR